MANQRPTQSTSSSDLPKFKSNKFFWLLLALFFLILTDLIFYFFDSQKIKLTGITSIVAPGKEKESISLDDEPSGEDRLEIPEGAGDLERFFEGVDFYEKSQVAGSQKILIGKGGIVEQIFPDEKKLVLKVDESREEIKAKESDRIYFIEKGSFEEEEISFFDIQVGDSIFYNLATEGKPAVWFVQKVN